MEVKGFGPYTHMMRFANSDEGKGLMKSAWSHDHGLMGLTLRPGTWGKSSLYRVLEEKQRYEGLREYEEAEGEEGKWMLWAPF